MIYVLLIILGIATRLLPHGANFTAVSAVALYSGYYIKNTKLAFGLPILLMVLSDWRLGFYQWQLMAAVYLAFLMVVVLGRIVGSKKWFWAVPASLAGTIIFFMVTNWSVWQFTSWYPHTLTGLISCLSAGVPFIKNAVMGDMVYTVALFGVTELAVYLVRRQKGKYVRVLVGFG